MGFFNISSNMLERRIQYRRRQSYRTRSNNFKPVKTPGGKLVMHLIKKHTRGTQMQGVKVARPHDLKRMTSTKRTVARAYGGIHTGAEVRDRIMRAFLIEEFRVFKNMSKAGGDKKDKKKKKKDDKKKGGKK